MTQAQSQASANEEQFADRTVALDGDDDVIEPVGQWRPRLVRQLHRHRHARRHAVESLILHHPEGEGENLHLYVRNT